MTKRFYSIAIFFVFLITALPASAQFIDVNLRLEPQIIAAVERPIRFGTVISGSGLRRVELGEQDMGIFVVEGLNGQEILVQINSSEQLISDPNDPDAPMIPIDLNIRNGKYLDNPFDSDLINLNTPTVLSIDNPESDAPTGRTFFYVYGSINVGIIPAGTYTGSVVLNVSYL